jgi:prephenate dehydrogenase
MSDCLHCDINELVDKHLEANEAVAAADVAARMAESLADFIVFSVPPEEQAKLLAHTIAHLGQMVIEKAESGDRDTKH